MGGVREIFLFYSNVPVNFYKYLFWITGWGGKHYFVEMNGMNSNCAGVISGVPQGSFLIPLLFLV